MGTESQLRRLGGGRNKNKNPPFFSHEFVIQNHADIMSCVLMVFVLGLMLKATNPIAAMFITLQHNVTGGEPVEEGRDAKDIPWIYTAGIKDLATIFFYSVGWIIAHAVLQEYVIDKIKSRVRLSKTKTSKFSESGQLAAFYLLSMIAAGYIISQENLLSKISSLWEDYPASHVKMSFLFKFFFIIQISYWIHNYPEFYFQKVKREEIKSRAIYSAMYLVLIAGGYVLNLTRVTLFLLALHYSAELVYHLARLAHFVEKTSVSVSLWRAWNIAFAVVRLLSAIVAVLTFWYGLRLTEVPTVDLVTGNFNTAFIRLNCLIIVCAVQLWLGWNFIFAWLRRAREHAPPPKKRVGAGEAKQKKAARRAEEEIRNLPEADQELRLRS